jgi:hypothetical protein
MKASILLQARNSQILDSNAESLQVPGVSQ